ncbi:MAG: YhbY family RNA-binding protein [Candidatus Nezhaarchaeales archaeon]
MSRGVKRRLKEKMLEDVDVNIGKQGLTEAVLKEINRRLDEQEIVKIRILKSALTVEGIEDRKKLAEIIAQKLDADAMEIRGYALVLYRRRRKRTL